MKQFKRILSLMLVIAALCSLLAFPANAADGMVDVTACFAGKTITMQSVENGKYLCADSDAADSPLRANRSSASTWETFTVSGLTSDGWVGIKAYNGKYLTASIDQQNGPVIAKYGHLQSWECFRIYQKGNDYYLKSQSNGKWLCVRTDLSGAPVQAYANAASTWERIRIRESTAFQKSPVIEEGEYYYIASTLDTSMVLDVNNGSSKNGANIQLYKKNATDAQLFRFVKSSKEGYYYIINKGSGKALDVANGATASGTNVQQYTRNNTQAQRWKVKYGYGTTSCVSIQAQCGKYLDVCNGEAKNGTNIWIYDGNNTSAQQFVLVPYVNYTYKTVTLDFHDIQSWNDAVALAQRSVTFGGSLVTNPSGKTYYNGKIITGIEVLEYKRLTVQIPAVGPGAYETKSVLFPSVLRFKLHSHTNKVKCWFTVTNLNFWQTCECGYHDEWSWEVPWPDLTEDTDTQTTSKVVDSIQPVWTPLYNVN